jgi:hypothetical protein
MIKPICEVEGCKTELKEYGAILLSPPDDEGRVMKIHICKECYKIFNFFIKKVRDANKENL